MSQFKTVRGMRDFLPKDAEKIRYVEKIARELAHLYGYEEVITPVLEHYDLLAAKSSEEIRERMYAFKDLGGRRVALRPEFTASIARLIATKMRNAPKPMKLFCTGSLYRYDEPQYGRFREFWQANYELIGSNEPETDMEIITLTNDLARRLGFRRYWFKIGHMGILRGILNQEGVAEGQQNLIMQLLDKKRWDEALTLAKESNISQNGITVLKKTLETKGKDVSQVLKTAKRVVADYDDAVAAIENLGKILELTEKSNVKFETIVEAGFARGLEYYTGIIFELYVPDLEIALGGGGRYDKLIELFGGEQTPAVGVAPGIDRLVLAMDKQKVSLKISEENKVMIIAVDEELRTKAVELSLTLRKAKIPVDVELMGRAVSKALSDADRRGATHAVIVGTKELKEGKVVLKDLKKREQRIVEIKTLSKEILKDTG